MNNKVLVVMINTFFDGRKDNMTKWIMSLDESGIFDEAQQYFILAGII